MTDEMHNVLSPIVATHGLELWDVEVRANVVRVTVDRPGGVGLDELAEVNRSVSAALDALDPIPGRYTLEVSSPGVERSLRTPDHFARAVGEVVSVKTRPQVPGDRRVSGTLSSADETSFELVSDGLPGGRIRLEYSDIDRARTVFSWGPTPRPGDAAGGPEVAGKTTNATKRKQVTTP